MKRACIALVALLLAAPLFSQQVTLTGTWELYRLDTIGTFTLNEYRASPPTRSFVDATIVLQADGTMTSDSQTLRFVSWGTHADFVYFRTPSGNSFYRVRDLSPDVLFLVSVVVTERNASVTQIQANPSANLILVRVR